jgi:integrase
MGFEPATSAVRVLPNDEKQRILQDFHDFLAIDCQLSPITIKDHICCIRQFLNIINKLPLTITKTEIRQFLKMNGNNHYVKAIRVFYGKYLNQPDLIQTFKIPRSPFKPIYLPKRNTLSQYYQLLYKPRDRAIFLLLATSGLRFHEVMELRHCDIDFEQNMIKPLIDTSSSKRAWCSFFNIEAKTELLNFIKNKGIHGEQRLFSKAKDPRKIRVFHQARKTFPSITPKTLRQWFCCEMARQGIPDRYVDAFTGRTPKSILARHYTDYSPHRLKEIYDAAQLTVFQ